LQNTDALKESVANSLRLQARRQPSDHGRGHFLQIFNLLQGLKTAVPSSCLG